MYRKQIRKGSVYVSIDVLDRRAVYFFASLVNTSMAGDEDRDEEEDTVRIDRQFV